MKEIKRIAGKAPAKPVPTKASAPAKGKDKHVNGEDDNPFTRKVKVNQLPKPPAAEKIQGNGVLGEVTVTGTKNPERSMITIPIHYPYEENDANRDLFTGRIFLNPAWLADDFDPKQLDEKELQQYNINYLGLYCHLLEAALGPDGEGGIGDLEGCIVGFSTRPRSDDPSQLQITRFYPPKIVEEE